jgi:hypothetical protein
MQCQVLRPFKGPGETAYAPGTVVDAAGWKWADRLIEQGYLRPVIVAQPMPAPPTRPRSGGTTP